MNLILLHSITVIQWRLAVLWNYILYASADRYHQSETEIEREAKIIELCKQNNGYFRAIYEKYYDQVFAYVFRRIQDEESTADVTSLVFYKCLNHIEKYSFRGLPFSSWLYRIAGNEINQYFREKKGADRFVSIDSGFIGAFFEEMDLDNSSVEPEVILERLFECLEGEEIQILELRFFENRSFKEMGEILDITDGNAKVKTYRVLEKLKKYAGKIRLGYNENE